MADLHGPRLPAGLNTLGRAVAALLYGPPADRQRWSARHLRPGDLITWTVVSIMGPLDGSEDTTEVGYLASWDPNGMACVVTARGKATRVGATLVRPR